MGSAEQRDDTPKPRIVNGENGEASLREESKIAAWRMGPEQQGERLNFLRRYADAMTAIIVAFFRNRCPS